MQGANKPLNSLVSILAILAVAWGFFAAQPISPPPSVLPDSCENTSTPDSGSLETMAEALPRRAELMQRMGVPAWHARGWRGRGLKIAILDSGFRGYRTHLGAALPASVKVRSFRFDGNLEAKNSQHGILCAEVIHALAPEAELLFANWEPEHPYRFLDAVRWARRQGARILSCSIIMPTWSDCQGGGRIHEELSRLLGPGERDDGALFFASAGNTARRHWSGSFRDDGMGWHVWKQDGQSAVTENTISPWGGERVSVELCCSAGTAYELSVLDAETRRLVRRTRSTDGGAANSAVAAFVPEADHDYRVRVRRLRSTSGRFHLFVLGGGLGHSRCQGSISFPGDGVEVIAVGAADATGRRRSYSSCGRRGGAVKPDLAAVVPFPSCWRQRPFSGTSAAAPQAAALAALIWSRRLDGKPQQIRDVLANAAQRGEQSGRIWETGRGLIRLPSPSAVRAASTQPLRVGVNLGNGVDDLLDVGIVAEQDRMVKYESSLMGAIGLR